MGQTGAGEVDEVRSHTGHTRSWNRKKRGFREMSAAFISSFINAFLSKCSRDLFPWKQACQYSVEENNPHFMHVCGSRGSNMAWGVGISALSSGRAGAAGAGGGPCKVASVSRAWHLANMAEGSPSGSVDQNTCLGVSNIASLSP